MKAKHWISALGLGGALLATGAWAQDTNSSRPERGPISVNLNGGLAGFTSGLNRTSSVGPTFGVSAVTHSMAAEKTHGAVVGLNVEGGYEGSEFPVSQGPHGEPGNGRIWRHNISGLVRGGVDIAHFTPYVGVGLGETYINVTDAADKSGLRNDWLTEIPTAVGLDYNIGNGLVAGVRGTYRFMLFGEFAEPTPADNNPSGALMGANATVGGKF